LKRKTGIKDVHNEMVHEGDIVRFPHVDKDEHLIVVYVGDGDDCDWAADKLNGAPDSCLDIACEHCSVRCI